MGMVVVAVWPSPKSHRYVSGSSSGSLDPLPLKLTVSGAAPLVGEAVRSAVGTPLAAVW
jgi:hypothetical protein